jgi:xanthine dehydrogenase accessory factor
VDDLLAQAYELARRRQPFALATVVRCERPTSAKPGAKALVHADGRVSGWIGGSCAEPLVVREALAAIRDGQPRLVALVGPDGGRVGAREGVREATMTCHSGGTLEIYVEPVLPRPQLALVGSGPVVATLARLGAGVGFEVVEVDDEARLPELVLGSDACLVVATHGRFDEGALACGLRTPAAYVSLVASPRRAAAVREALLAAGLEATRVDRLKAPAGLDLGAVTPEEIAVSILAEIVQLRRRAAPAVSAPPAAAGASPVADDPVCGMAVTVAGARQTSEVAGRVYYFCCAGCKAAFDREPGRYSSRAPAVEEG